MNDSLTKSIVFYNVNQVGLLNFHEHHYRLAFACYYNQIQLSTLINVVFVDYESMRLGYRKS